MISVVTIGGGTGQYTLLTGLKKHPLMLTAIVAMADDGGSTGRLRDELGVLPPGDVRQCLVALSDESTHATMRKLFNYRFEDEGGLQGHSFGNLFISALEKVTGSFEEAVETAAQVLNVHGSVVPVTSDNIRLVCEGPNGSLSGEHCIDTGSDFDPGTLRLQPEPTANPKAVSVIMSADCIVIGPGDVYTSIVPNLLVREVREAIAATAARVVLNCNLMTKPGHTDGFGVNDFVAAVERYIGKGRIDDVIYNTDMPDAALLQAYTKAGEKLVDAKDVTGNETYRAIGVPLLGKAAATPSMNDSVPRSLIRHDQDALALAIVTNCLKTL